MNAVSARKFVAFFILAVGISIGVWASSDMRGSDGPGAMLFATVLVALPFGVLALIARFLPSSWFSLVLVLIAVSGAAWFSIYVYPSSRGDAQGALVFVFVPMLLCMGAGVVAVPVLLAEAMVRARARLARARLEPDAAVAAKQVSSSRWMFAVSAVLFAVVAGTIVTLIARQVLRHHEVNTAENLTSQEERLRVLEKALTDQDDEILGILAHQDLPGEALRRIHEAARKSRYGGSTALYNLASNPQTPTDLLASLATGDTARSVALNPSAPAAILERLAAHEDRYVRRQVAVNPSVSKDLLAKLAEDDDEMVRQTAEQKLKQSKNKGKAGKKKATIQGNP